MPPESLWVQYSLIGILILAACVIAAGFYKLWKDLLKWMQDQNAERVAEREKQRTWEAEQTTIRDAQWQLFLKTMQDQWLEQDCRNTGVLEKLVGKVEALTTAVNNHDTWARAKDGK